MNKEKFLIDANSLITPFNNYYAFDFDSKFWIQLEKHIESGSVIILDLVKNEIENKTDDLSNWFQNLTIKEFINHNEQDIFINYSKIMNYLNNTPIYQKIALRDWQKITVADPWLIATAMAKNLTIITFEQAANPNSGNPSKRIKIPDVAKQFKIEVQNLYYMMRCLNIKL